MPDDETVSFGSVTERTLDAALARVRRRDLFVWRRAPTWIENTGAFGRDRLVAWRNGGVEAISGDDVPMGSTLYGYGAPAWTPLDDTTALILRRDRAAAVALSASGRFEAELDLGDAESAGYPRGLSGGEVVVVLDRGRGVGRALAAGRPGARARIIYETDGFIGDLTVDKDTSALAWIEWSVGAMPWDASRALLATFAEGRLRARVIESVRPCAQTTFVRGQLFVGVAVGEWVLPHRWDGDHLVALPAELGEYRSDWTFGRRWVAGNGRGVVFGYVRNSRAGFSVLSPLGTRTVSTGGPAYLYDLAASGKSVYALASTTTESMQLFRIDPQVGRWQHLGPELPSMRCSGDAELRWSGTGVPYVWRAPPRPPDGGASVKPGLVVIAHGGPTQYAGFEFSWIDELLCGVNLALAYVDYRGSPSYGRAHRDSLNGQWGDADVADVRSVIGEIVDSGAVDPARVYLRGISAGGLTALLSSRGSRVCGVVVINPVTDLTQLAQHESDLEIGQIEQLVGAPVGDRRYDERSPVRHAAEIAERVLLVRGADDQIVPAKQARALVVALRRAGKSVTLLELAGEGHQLRGLESLRAAYRAELAFYAE